MAAMPTRIFRMNIRAFVLPAAFVLGCEHAPPFQLLGVPLQPTLSSIQANIFDRKCAIGGCHVGPGAPPIGNGMDLSSGDAFGNTVNIPSAERPTLFRIEPFNADSSYLVLKIEGAPGIVGQQMPFGRSPLSQGEIDVIRQWIDDGAGNN